ncbi:MAG: hypothetical protein IVW54_11680 [Candidatus Binataceae bacterium]|nr:hypothetical protein [Candidatus Binataceae bacterium]
MNRRNINGIWIAGLALVLSAATPALAGHRMPHSVSNWSQEDSSGSSFSAATLNGTYVFEASGFADDGKPGEVSVLGTLTFDGTSAVTGNLIFTRGDNAQYSCADTITTGGTYSFTGTGTAPGLYSMVIPLTGGNNTGSLNFGLLVADSDGNRAKVIETDSGSLVGVVICGPPGITSMVLKGSLHALPDQSGD